MLVSLELPSANGLRETLYAAFTDLANYALFDDVHPVLASLREQGITRGDRVELRGVAGPAAGAIWRCGTSSPSG